MDQSEHAVHDAIVEEIRKKLRHQYKEIKINLSGEKAHEFNGEFPDMVLSEHGMVLALVEVETENSFSPDKIEVWRKLVSGGPRLMVILPKHMKAKLTSALWDSGIADKISLGGYEITITMP